MTDSVEFAVRLLGIDFSSRGFGFVVLERPRFPLDWGVVRLPNNDPRTAPARFSDLLSRYRPDALVIEDVAQNPRRSERVRKRSGQVTRIAHEDGTPSTLVAPLDLRRFFAAGGVRTKFEAAVRVAEALPALSPLLPPRRKPWAGEAESMAVFDAAAMVFYAMGEMPTLD